MAAESPDLTFSAELEVEKAPAGAWTGKLVTADTSAAFAAYGLLPKHKDAQALFKVWSAGARGDGRFRARLSGSSRRREDLHEEQPDVGDDAAVLKMLPRLDATRDWSGQDAIALLDELAAVQATPIRMVLDEEWERTIRTGAPLPPELASAPWGETLPGGLRLAWLLGAARGGVPARHAAEIAHPYPQRGKDPVVFRTRTWHQVRHKATDAKGADIKVDRCPGRPSGGSCRSGSRPASSSS